MLCIVMAMRSSAPLNQLLNAERTEGRYLRRLWASLCMPLPLRRPADWAALMILRRSASLLQKVRLIDGHWPLLMMARRVVIKGKGQIPEPCFRYDVYFRLTRLT